MCCSWKNTNIYILYSTILYCTLQYYIVLQCIIMYSTVFYCPLLEPNVLFCILLYFAVLYCTLQNSTVLYCVLCNPLLWVFLAKNTHTHTQTHTDTHIYIYKYIYIYIYIGECWLTLPGSGHIVLPLLIPFQTVNLMAWFFWCWSISRFSFQHSASDQHHWQSR